MLPLVTKNPANIFSAKLNLLVLFTHTDLAKAKSFAERLLLDIDDYLPSHQRELYFAVANIYLLNGQYPQAKAFYRNCLKLSSKPLIEAKILNNLAVACWYHKKQSKSDSVDQDASYIVQYFKDAIGLVERTMPDVNETQLVGLLNESKDYELRAIGHDKTITNLSEYLL
jgi:tetratricopeptide (TPR) repeat protein